MMCLFIFPLFCAPSAKYNFPLQVIPHHIVVCSSGNLFTRSKCCYQACLAPVSCACTSLLLLISLIGPLPVRAYFIASSMYFELRLRQKHAPAQCSWASVLCSSGKAFRSYFCRRRPKEDKNLQKSHKKRPRVVR
jgi:hypothetical protein